MAILPANTILARGEQHDAAGDLRFWGVFEMAMRAGKRGDYSLPPEGMRRHTAGEYDPRVRKQNAACGL